MSDHHHRLAWTGIIAAVVLAAGLLAMNFPVFLDSYDQYGWQIRCGTGYVTDLAVLRRQVVNVEAFDR